MESWTEGVAAVVSVTGDEESDVCVRSVGDSSDLPDVSVPLSRSGSSGMLTTAWVGVSGGVGRSSASSTTCGGGRARGEMIIAGAVEGSVGLRDHIANSFLDFSTVKVADCFVTNGEVRMGENSSDDGVECTSECWGAGSDTDTGSDTDPVTGSGTGSGADSGVGSRAGSKTGSEAGSGAVSDICSTS